ncbi:MAG: hypothetical protein HYZ37_13495 [Candidatus Solibacter usitatus]|nr:hypothetical protein [Candidatus Solibacter usitatus]
MARYLVVLILSSASAFCQNPFSIRSYGFVELISATRPSNSPDTINTRFGKLPLTDSHAKTVLSPAHSRFSLDGEASLWGGKVSGYLEADFLSGNPASPYRNRQYFGQYSSHGWEVSAGQMWSFLRPNRMGLNSRANLMNTYAVDPAYHVGLAGVRDRQVRVVHHGERWHAGVSMENGKDILPKIARDGDRLHWEITGVVGRRGHHGISAAAVWKLNRHISLMGQQYVARGGGVDALNTAGAETHASSTIGGIECQVRPNLRVFGYGGMVYASRWNGNRDVREFTVGMSRIIAKDKIGEWITAFQVSQLDRSQWTGGSGSMHLVMASLRHSFGQPR